MCTSLTHQKRFQQRADWHEERFLKYRQRAHTFVKRVETNKNVLKGLLSIINVLLDEYNVR